MGLAYPSEIAKHVSEMGCFKYLPLTDLGNLFGYVKHYRACKQYGLKPIYGVDLTINGIGDITLLAKTNVGFSNIKKLTSLHSAAIANSEELTLDKVKEYSEGVLIFLNQTQIINSNVRSLATELDIVCKLDLLQPFDLSELTGLKIVPSIDVLFLNESDKHAHDVRVCIQQKELIEEFESKYSSCNCPHSPVEFKTFFNNIPENVVFTSAEELYGEIKVDLDIDLILPPKYQFTNGKLESEFLIERVYEGFECKLDDIKANNPTFQRSVYEARIKSELDVIVGKNLCGYYLIVWEFVNWAKEKGIPVGPGRGSGAGSLLAYLLNIVDLDPIKYDLLFERFLNPERNSLPDFDIDFCSKRRDEVIEYVKQRFGQAHASQICTFGCMKAKSVIRDVARVLDVEPKLADMIAKSIPTIPDITIKEALKKSPEFKEFYSDDSLRDLFKISIQLEGVVRSVGKHAAGVVISNSELVNLTPIYHDEVGGSSIMLDMADSEAVGLVKFDFLSLGNLTIIDETIELLRSTGVDLDLSTINLNDKSVYEFMRKGLTQGTFQLLSHGMRGLIKRLKPDCFEDVIALVALFRPGPLQSGMVDNFIDRKHGIEQVSYPDPKYQLEILKSTLAPTYGVILYQEQVMQIARLMAGYSLANADLLRRAMGKKKPEEMAKQKDAFINGAVNNGIESTLAERIFELVEKFAGYGFNRSHSAVYALIAYQTVFLKYYYSAHYMSCVLTYESMNKGTLSSLIDEATSYGLKVLPPDINVSKESFYPISNTEVSFGLTALKGIGEGFAERLVKIREEGGAFNSLQDLYRRVPMNKPQLSSLIFSGSLKSIASYVECLDFLGERFGFDKTKYAICIDSESQEENVIRAIGVSFQASSKLAEFTEELRLANCLQIENLDNHKFSKRVLVGGYISGAKVLGGKVSRFVGQLQDTTGKVSFVGWSDFVENFSDSVKNGELYLLEVNVGEYQGEIQLTVLRAWDKKFVKRRLGL